MRIFVTGLFSCALLALPVAAQSNASTSGKGGTSDQAFVDLAAQSDMTEAHLGELAQDNAASPAVKEYAQMLRSEHTADYTKLTALATKAGLTVPKGLDPKQTKLIMPLEKLKGAAFDKRFAHEMVTSHETAIAAYDKEGREGQNPDLQAYAKATVPDLEKHKSSAQDLLKPKK